jgi:predicted nuclease with RNAse H fold
MRTVGIDLAGKPENDTGFCILTDEGTETRLLHTDTDILAAVEAAKPDIVAMDAPFWLPKGNWRPCEEALMRRGFRPLSPAFQSMRMLTMRAMHLVRVIAGRGYKVIEVFPRASEQILGLSKEPRKNQDEYDALLAALTGKAYMEGKYEDVAGIILPK